VIRSQAAGHFDTEAQLVAALEHYVFKIFPSMQTSLREVPTKDGIADMVLGKPVSVSRLRRMRTHFRHDCLAAQCSPFVNKKKICLSDLFSEVIAIEAKLYDWPKALYQASRYRQFANRCYVALDAVGTRRALRNRTEFYEANVGLISVASGRARILIASPTQRPYAIESSGPIGARSFLSSDRLIRHRVYKSDPRSMSAIALNA